MKRELNWRLTEEKEERLKAIISTYLTISREIYVWITIVGCHYGDGTTLNAHWHAEEGRYGDVRVHMSTIRTVAIYKITTHY